MIKIIGHTWKKSLGLHKGETTAIYGGCQSRARVITSLKPWTEAEFVVQDLISQCFTGR